MKLLQDLLFVAAVCDRRSFSENRQSTALTERRYNS